MAICPKCGKLLMCADNKEKNCNICNTHMIKSDIISSNYFDLSNEEKDKLEEELRQKYTYSSPLYDPQKAKERYEAFMRDVPSPSNTAKCPTCKSTNIRKIGGFNKVSSAVMFGIFSLGHISKSFRCNNCGYKW